MKEKQIKSAGKDIVYLLRCLLHSDKPDIEYIKAMNLNDLYSVSKYHSIEAMIYIALELSGLWERADQLSSKLFQDWKKEKELLLYKNTLMDIEREELIQYLEEQGIWYMLLKGVIFDEFYPQPGIRQMADNDILFDKEYAREIYEYMVSRGYQVVEFGESNHDEYLRSPVYNFEMHRELYGTDHGPIWPEYYKDVKLRLIKDDENNYGYHFKDEDFYIYIITHAFNHYDTRGTGLKTLIDEYLYLRKKKSELDWKYIEQELKKLGINKFEEDLRNLSNNLFDTFDRDMNIRLSQKEQKMFDYILFSGTYGTEENRVKYKLRSIQSEEQTSGWRVRVKYILRRVFPDQEFYKTYYPRACRMMQKHKWTVPLVHIWRIFRGIFVKPKEMMKELITAIGKQ